MPLILVLVVVGLLIIVSIGQAYESTCPKCGRFGGGEKIGAKEIPGTNYTRREPHNRYIEHYVKVRVRCRCKHCGHRWEKEESRRVG